MKMSSLVSAALLYRQSYRVLNKVVSDVLKKVGLTPLEWAFLSAIFYHDGITITDLANILGVETPMISQLILIETIKPVIKIKKHTKDKRVRTLHLTATAKKNLTKLEAHLENELQHFFQGVKEKDMAAHLRVLSYIADKEVEK